MTSYVTTRKFLKAAFDDWKEKPLIDDNERERRAIIEVVFWWFMDSAYAKSFQPSGGALVSFSINQWKEAFKDWADAEIVKQPDKAGNIIKFTQWVESHITSSSWAADYKLILT